MVNKVTLIGNLGRDPELFQTQNGRAVARLSIATNEVWMKDGERQRRTEWHRVVVWGPRAERTAQLRKGTPVYVEGRLRTRPVTNADNVEQMRTEIHSLRLMPLRSQTQRETAYAAPEADGFRDGDEVPFRGSREGRGAEWCPGLQSMTHHRIGVRSMETKRYRLKIATWTVVRESGQHSPRKLDSPEAVVDLARDLLHDYDDDKEHFWVILLNAQNHYLLAHMVSTGTQSSTLVHPREVLGPASGKARRH